MRRLAMGTGLWNVGVAVLCAYQGMLLATMIAMLLAIYAFSVWLWLSGRP